MSAPKDDLKHAGENRTQNLVELLNKWVTPGVIVVMVVVSIVAASLLSQLVHESYGIDSSVLSDGGKIAVMGGGGTWAGPLYQSLMSLASWNIMSQGYNTSFALLGSGAGRTAFFANQLLFAGSDNDYNAAQSTQLLPATLDPNSLSASSYPTAYPHLGTVMFPSLVGALAIAYNLPNVQNQVVMSGAVLAQVFLRNVTNWSDSSIQALNPTLTLPNATILLVVRGEASGTTEIFTRFLSASSTDFASAVGFSQVPGWIAPYYSARTASDMLVMVNNLAYTVGYVPMDSIQASILAGYKVQIASLINPAGNIVTPSISTVSSAIDGAPITYSKHMFQLIFNSPGNNSYPLSLFTFVIMREHYYWFDNSSSTSRQKSDCGPVRTLLKFWKGVLNGADQIALQTALGWIPLTATTRDLANQLLSTITCHRVPVLQSASADASMLNLLSGTVACLQLLVI